MRLVLASASPQRKDLLLQIGAQPDEILNPDIDETPRVGEKPRHYCRRLAAEKANAVAITSGDIILAADTTVAVGRLILGKPKNAAMARTFLRKLSGRRHRVITAVAVKTVAHMWQRNVLTVVKFCQLSDQDINAYIQSGEWQGRAGAYGIQGQARRFIPWLRGSCTSVIGLPLTETFQLLNNAGYQFDQESGADS